jgi:hypothetical protein
MSNYTPTTGHILEAFAWDERYDGLDTEKMKQFDRWLAEVKAQAWEEGWLMNVDDRYSSRDDNPYRQRETE